MTHDNNNNSSNTYNNNNSNCTSKNNNNNSNSKNNNNNSNCISSKIKLSGHILVLEAEQRPFSFK